jgi:hypothetical protein
MDGDLVHLPDDRRPEDGSDESPTRVDGQGYAHQVGVDGHLMEGGFDINSIEPGEVFGVEVFPGVRPFRWSSEVRVGARVADSSWSGRDGACTRIDQRLKVLTRLEHGSYDCLAAPTR